MLSAKGPLKMASLFYNRHWLAPPILTVVACASAGYLLMWAYSVYQSPEVRYLLDSLYSLCGWGGTVPYAGSDYSPKFAQHGRTISSGYWFCQRSGAQLGWTEFIL